MSNSGHLYLICPECCLEETLRRHFRGRNFFLTMLGAVFDLANYSFGDSIQNLLDEQNIDEINVINDLNCSFFKNAIEPDDRINEFYAAKVIKEVESAYHVANDPLLNAHQKLKRMAEINVWEQMDRLKYVPQISDLMVKKNISVKGFTYDRHQDIFQEVISGPAEIINLKILTN